jgi:transcriptional regulator with GAF, ATPase, and Fis domain
VVAGSDTTVLLLGETGTGKEVIARAIHNRSPRRQRAFVKSIKRCWLSRTCFQMEPATHLFRRSAIEERNMIRAALAETPGRVSGPSGAAAELSIPPSTLESKIRAMNINKYSFRIPSRAVLA